MHASEGEYPNGTEGEEADWPAELVRPVSGSAASFPDWSEWPNLRPESVRRSAATVITVRHPDGSRSDSRYVHKYDIPSA